MFSAFWIDVVDWLWLAYGEPPNLMSLKPWFILLSTLSRRDSDSTPPPSARLFVVESNEVGRSNRRRSALPGVVGDTIDATLMLLAGDTRG